MTPSRFDELKKALASQPSRRRLLRGLGAAALTSVIAPALPISRVLAGGQPPLPLGSEPSPLSGGIGGLHAFAPGRGQTISTIGDFDGIVGIADLEGSGSGTLATGVAMPFSYSIDNRFMVGDYVGADGLRLTGAFAEL